MVSLKRVLAIAALVVATLAGGLILWSIKKPMDVGGDAPSAPLRVSAYSSFTTSWGPGPKIVASFEKRCACTVLLEDSGDSGLLLQKLKLGSQNAPDVIIGLDSYQALESDISMWRDISALTSSVALDLSSLGSPRSSHLLPFDWAPIAFVYRKGELAPPKSLDDLLDARFKNAIALEDPRTSTPGMQFLAWVAAVYGTEGTPEFLSKLKGNLHSISPSWSTAYGLFKKKEAKLVLSYLTSPLYHKLAENDAGFDAAVFEHGHVAHVEFAGIPAGCTSCARAEEFLKFLLESESQTRLMELNYMLPVALTPSADSEFLKLAKPKILPLPSQSRKELLALWKAVFSP